MNNEYSCRMCDENAVNMEDMRRHVAVAHGRGHFSTLICGNCSDKFYDFVHFHSHTKATPACNPISMSEQKLAQPQEEAFASLIQQITRKLDPIPTSPAAPSVQESSSTTPSLVSCKQEFVEVNANAVVDSKEPVCIDLLDDSDDEPTVPNQISVSGDKRPQSTESLSVSNELPVQNTTENPDPKSDGSKVEKKRNGPKVTGSGETSPILSTAQQIPKAKGASVEKKLRGEMGGSKKSSSGKFAQVKEEPWEDLNVSVQRRRATQNVSYREVSSSDDEETKKEQKVPENGKEGGEQPDQTRDRTKISLKLLDLCQLCVELQNDRPPIFKLEEKQSHAIIHLKFAATFADMAEEEVRNRPEFTKIMKMCFEPGYYEEMKRKFEGEQEEGGDGEEQMEVDEQ